MRRLRYLRAGARALGTASCLAAFALTVSGCGPVEYLSQVNGKAVGAVAAAKQSNAERYAPYEYTAAVAYLQKAREEAGYAEYQIAIEYGRRAENLAIRARAIADQEARARPATGSNVPVTATPDEPSVPGEDSP